MKPNIKKLLILNAPYLLIEQHMDKVSQELLIYPGVYLTDDPLYFVRGVSSAF